ncbi:MAG: response regulator transcription factor [Gemmatimonadetes bacterium]|nr:response regulator transcription factor [Gemmatimonadota bacterium]MBL0177877.1 response regulator transcription factor [Gemmatimonadota bacterium]
MTLPHLLLVTPDAMLASFLDRVLRGLYRVTPFIIPGALRHTDQLLAAVTEQADLLLLDARHIAPFEVASFVAANAHPALLLIAPAGLRTEAIPKAVRGAVTHLATASEFRVVLDTAMDGEDYLSPVFSAEDRLRYWQLPTPPTERHRAVFELKRRGRTTHQIMAELGLEQKTVEGCITALRAGFGLAKREVFDWRDGRL